MQPVGDVSHRDTLFRSEGCPNSVIEYMQFGLPVVGTNIPGIRDLVGDVGVRYLFPVGDFI